MITGHGPDQVCPAAINRLFHVRVRAFAVQRWLRELAVSFRGRIVAFGIFALVAALALSGCGGNGGDHDGDSGGTPSIAVAPTSVNMTAGDAGVVLTATLAGGATGPVSWSLSADAPGSLAPATGPSTTYTPPAALAADVTLAVTATAGAVSGTATVILRANSTATPGLVISPDAASTTARGAGLVFTAELSGGATGPVTWSLPSGAPGVLVPGVGESATFFVPPEDLAGVTTVTLTATAPGVSDTATIDLQLARAPVDTTLELQSGQAVVGEIDLAAGGTVEAFSVEGIGYVLEIPPQTRGGETLAITMTPIDDLVGLPVGLGFLAGVHLEPEGFDLEPAATLTITAGEPVDTADLFAFGYAGSGRNFHMLPHDEWLPGTNTAELIVSHFSGTGVASGAQAATGLSPSGAGARMEQEIAALMASAKARGVVPWYDPASRAAFSGIMWRAFELGVWPLVVSAEAAVEASLELRPWSTLGRKALNDTELAGFAFVNWFAELQRWSQGVFDHQPPVDWPYARRHWDWSGFFKDVGLAASLDDDIIDAANSLDTDVLRGPQDPQCRALPAVDICLRYEYLEEAVQWASRLRFIVGHRDWVPDASIRDIDVNEYCGGVWQTYVGDILIVRRDSLPWSTVNLVKLNLDESAELEGIALDAAGSPLDPQPELVWGNTNPAAATLAAVVEQGLPTGRQRLTAVRQGETEVSVEQVQACRSATAQVRVYPQPAVYSGSSEARCGGTLECGCGHPDPSNPDVCVDETWEYHHRAEMRLWNQGDDLGFSLTLKSSRSSNCRTFPDQVIQRDSAVWPHGGEVIGIPPWQFGLPERNPFYWPASLYLPVQAIFGVASGNSVQIETDDSPMCGAPLRMTLTP